ncbi:MAG: hypothetical protein OXJ62_16120 [Spirochaetaceae bacterium]|nr:hypothetical protein [Spirochaetaceae bacterium]
MKNLLVIILGILSFQIGLAQETKKVDTSFSSADRALEYQDMQTRDPFTGCSEAPRNRFDRSALPEPPLENVYPVIDALSKVSKAAEVIKAGMEIVEAIDSDGLDLEIGEGLERAKMELENAEAQLRAMIEHLNTPEGVSGAVCGECGKHFEDEIDRDSACDSFSPHA